VTEIKNKSQLEVGFCGGPATVWNFHLDFEISPAENEPLPRFAPIVRAKVMLLA
jgi:hypothetical protein